MLHHGVAYACGPSDVPKVEALSSMGPYDRLKQGMLCEQFFMVGAVQVDFFLYDAVQVVATDRGTILYLASGTQLSML
jgi:hypothetical protein